MLWIAGRVSWYVPMRYARERKRSLAWQRWRQRSEGGGAHARGRCAWLRRSARLQPCRVEFGATGSGAMARLAPPALLVAWLLPYLAADMTLLAALPPRAAPALARALRRALARLAGDAWVVAAFSAEPDTKAALGALCEALETHAPLLLISLAPPPAAFAPALAAGHASLPVLAYTGGYLDRAAQVGLPCKRCLSAGKPACRLVLPELSTKTIRVHCRRRAHSISAWTRGLLSSRMLSSLCWRTTAGTISC